MDWLNDRKNLPLVAALSVLIVLGAVVWILYSMGFMSSLRSTSRYTADTQDTGAQRFQPQVVAGAPPVASLSAIKIGSVAPPKKTPPPVKVAAVVPPAPIIKKPAPLVSVPIARPAPPVAPPISKVVKSPPVVKPGSPTAVAAAPPEKPVTSQSVLRGKDPFYIPGTPTAPAGTVRLVAAAPPLVVPAVNIYRLKSTSARMAPDPNAPPIDQPAGGRRVAGIMYSNGVYAILESNGQAVSVQPGDQVDGDRVISIQSDGVILRTPGNVLVHVPLTDGGGSSAPSVGPGGSSLSSNYQNYVPPQFRN